MHSDGKGGGDPKTSAASSTENKSASGEIASTLRIKISTPAGKLQMLPIESTMRGSDLIRQLTLAPPVTLAPPEQQRISPDGTLDALPWKPCSSF